MTEPVGNARRDAGPLPGSNSHATRAAAEKATAASKPAEEREEIKPVVHGKVIQKKPNVFKRAARGMVADDVTNVGDFVLTDVLMPAVRNLVYDIVSQGAHRVLFGTARGPRRGVGAAAYMNGGANLKTAYHRVSNEPTTREPTISRSDMARHNFDEIILDNRDDALEVLENLLARVERYGTASVADFYDYIGVTGGFTDQAYGWKSLAGADVRQTRKGFVFDLPRPIALR
jgi:hypothetical protein